MIAAMLASWAIGVLTGWLIRFRAQQIIDAGEPDA